MVSNVAAAPHGAIYTGGVRDVARGARTWNQYGGKQGVWQPSINTELHYKSCKSQISGYNKDNNM